MDSGHRPEVVLISKSALEKRVLHWQEALAPLGLAGWRLEKLQIVDVCRTGSSSTACVSTSKTYDSFWLEFKRDQLPNKVNGELDEVIVHELLHVMFRDYDEVVSDASRWMPSETWCAWDHLVDHEKEGVIERLARVIVALGNANKA